MRQVLDYRSRRTMTLLLQVLIGMIMAVVIVPRITVVSIQGLVQPGTLVNGPLLMV